MSNLLLLLLLLLFSTTIVVDADTNSFVYAGCSQPIYDSGSAFQLNVESIITSFANAASNSLFGKFTSDTASPYSPVYGLYQCRGDLSIPSCESCVRSAISHLSPICPSATGAAVQLDGCLIRYGNESFLGKPETNLLFKKCGPPSPNGYDPNLMGMRDNALAAIESSGGTGGTYRVGAAGFVQAAAQCVGDLNTKDCSDCISNAIGQLKSLCGDAVDGNVYLGKCFTKYYSIGYSSSSENFDHWQEAGRTLAIVIGLIAGVTLIVIFASFLKRAGNSK